MNIIVAGLGKIGVTLISNLVTEGHDVVVIDNDPQVVEDITNIYDVMGVCGNCADTDVLAEAGAKNAELLIAVAGSDELNMLSCFLAKKIGTKNTIARVRAPEYNDRSLGIMKQHLELSMIINPEALAARELFHNLKLPSAAKVETFSVRNFEMIEQVLKANSPLEGVSLSELRSRFKAKFLICAVKRGSEAYIPDGNFVLKSGDRIGLTAEPTEIVKLLKEMGVVQTKAKNVMILGGSRTAFYLAKRLAISGSKVTIIEKDRQLCEELSELIPKATIICGDGANQELLIEEGLHSVDAFVSLTGMDEENILLCSYASSEGVPKVIAKVNRDSLRPLAEHWGLDTIISPKLFITNVILQYVRALQNSEGSSVETLYKLMDDKVEALEFNVKSDLGFLNKTFKELTFKKNTLVAGIIRDRKIIIPSGDDCLKAGDKVIVLAANQRLNKLSDILA
ncbi:MAG: Trk system potassium transporter TrkA [Clostridia bacterium]|nr:Trk system potassium transporter TrkA [Clostridia bacterium]